VRVTIRHHFDFGGDRALVGDDLVQPGAWDALRTGTRGPFSLADSLEELARDAEARPEIAERARALDSVLDVPALASYGVGAGVLEWWLRRIRPERRLVLGDYAPRTVEQLRVLFPDADVRTHDLLRDAPLPADAHLFHRIDTELTNAEWRGTFHRFAGETIILVATEIATTKRLLQELQFRLQHRHASRAGWLRTRDAFGALWRDTHEARPLRAHDLDAWVLTPRAS
jgi:hypothetical protein